MVWLPRCTSLASSLPQSSQQAAACFCLVKSSWRCLVRPISPRSGKDYTIRKSFSTSAVRRNTVPADADLGESIRALMRSSAQPVAVITALIDANRDETIKGTVLSDRIYAHGATLSSFTTVSMDPPLVAFSLRTPSRIADCLLAGAQANRRDLVQSIQSHKGKQADAATNEYAQPHFVINVLSKGQEEAADGFARPGLAPFALPKMWGKQGEEDKRLRRGNQHTHPLDRVDYHESQHAIGTSSNARRAPVPVLSTSIGSLACSLVGRLDLSVFGNAEEDKGNTALGDQPAPEVTTGSDLFLARVHAVDELTEVPAGPDEAFPLIYWERKFTTIKR